MNNVGKIAGVASLKMSLIKMLGCLEGNHLEYLSRRCSLDLPTDDSIGDRLQKLEDTLESEKKGGGLRMPGEVMGFPSHPVLSLVMANSSYMVSKILLFAHLPSLASMR